jgi:hypothetical protein
MRNVLDNICRRNQTHILYRKTFFRKLHRLWDNVEKCGGDWGATNDVTIWRICVACWKSKATCTYAYVHAHALGYPDARTQARTHRPISNTYCFSAATMFVNAPQCYVIRALPVLLRTYFYDCRDTYIACLVKNVFLRLSVSQIVQV